MARRLADSSGSFLADGAALRPAGPASGGRLLLGRWATFDGAHGPGPLALPSHHLVTHAVAVRHDRERQDRARVRAGRGGAAQRHPGRALRPQGRPRQPPVLVLGCGVVLAVASTSGWAQEPRDLLVTQGAYPMRAVVASRVAVGEPLCLEDAAHLPVPWSVELPGDRSPIDEVVGALSATAYPVDYRILRRGARAVIVGGGGGSSGVPLLDTALDLPGPGGPSEVGPALQAWEAALESASGARVLLGPRPLRGTTVAPTGSVTAREALEALLDPIDPRYVWTLNWVDPSLLREPADGGYWALEIRLPPPATPRWPAFEAPPGAGTALRADDDGRVE